MSRYFLSQFLPLGSVWNKKSKKGRWIAIEKALLGQIKIDKNFRSNQNQIQDEAAEMNEHPQTAHL